MRKFATGLIVLALLLAHQVLGQNTITTSNLTQTSLCAGGNIIVQYTSTGTYPLGCVFYAELSDAMGNFSSPVVVGSVPINTGIIAGTIPTGTGFGFNYRVRVVASNPYTVGSESTTPIIITSTAVSATILANPGTEVCEGDTITLWASFNQSYYWSTGETSQTIHVTESGSYTVTVTNFITGCEVTSDPKEIIVHPSPVVNLGPNLQLCDGNFVTLDAGAGFAQYAWNDSIHSQSIDVDTAGSYAVIVTDTNGCTGGDIIQIAFVPNPFLDLGPDTNLCGNSIVLSAGFGFLSYNWNNGLSFNPTLAVSTSGFYFVAITDSNGCSNNDSVLVGIHPLPGVELGNDLSACGSAITLDGGTGYTNYNWNNGAGTDRYFDVIISGDYTIEVTDQYGCSGADTLHVDLFALPEIDLGGEIPLLVNDSLTIDAGAGFVSYLWSTGQTTQTITVRGWEHNAGPVELSVTVMDDKGCSNTAHLIVMIIAETGMVGTAYFPNPFHDELSFISDKDLTANTPVFIDMLGQAYFPPYSAVEHSMVIQRGTLANGCYMLYLKESNEMTLMGKFIIY